MLSTKLKRAGYSGILLLLVVGGILALFVTVAGRRVLSGTGYNNFDYHQKQAHYAANTALQLALRKLSDVLVWDSQRDDRRRVLLDAQEQVYYSYLVVDNRLGSGPIPTPDGTRIAPGQAYIRTLGEVRPFDKLSARACYTSKAGVAEIGTAAYNYGAIVKENFAVVNASIVDGYNSAGTGIGQYSPSLPWNPYLFNGHVLCTGGPSKIHLKDSMVIGTLAHLIGPGQPKLEGNYRATLLPVDRRLAVPSYRPPYHPALATQNIVVGPGQVRLLDPGAYASITVQAGGKLLLNALPDDFNQFYIRDSIVIQGGDVCLAQTKLRDRVQLYVGNRFVCDNGWVNAQGYPCQIALYMVGNGSFNASSEFTLRNGSQAWMVVAANGLNAEITQYSHLFGSIKCKNLKINALSGLHYDIALRSARLLSGLLTFDLWEVSDLGSPSVINQIMALAPGLSDPAPAPPPSSTAAGQALMPLAIAISEPPPPVTLPGIPALPPNTLAGSSLPMPVVRVVTSSGPKPSQQTWDPTDFTADQAAPDVLGGLVVAIPGPPPPELPNLVNTTYTLANFVTRPEDTPPDSSSVIMLDPGTGAEGNWIRDFRI